MPDYMAAEIWIGGCLPRRKIKKLCAAITADHAAIAWGDAPFRPENVDDLEDGTIDRDGVRLLWLCNEQAPWGGFEDLELFLLVNKLPFTRRSEGRWEYDGERIDFRPGRKPTRFVINASGEPVVTVASVQAGIDQLTAVARMRPALPREGLLRQVRNGIRRLQAALPPIMPPLEDFWIGD